MSRTDSRNTLRAMSAIALTRLLDDGAPRSRPRLGRVTCWTKKSSSVSRIGLSDTSCAPAAVSSASSAIGRRIERQLERVAAFADARRRACARAPSAASAGVADAGHDELPAAHLERQHLGQPAGRHQPALGQNRDAAAQRLGVAQDVRAEEHRAAAIAQPQDQRAHVAAAERIEPRHRLVEDHELGIVDERLRDADALQHALRELAQLQPPLGADADLVEQPARRGRAARRRDSRTAPAKYVEQLFGRQVVVEVRILREVADAPLDRQVAERAAEELGAARRWERPAASAA